MTGHCLVGLWATVVHLQVPAVNVQEVAATVPDEQICDMCEEDGTILEFIETSPSVQWRAWCSRTTTKRWPRSSNLCARIVRKIKWKNFLTESEEEKGRIDFLTSKVDPDPENSKHSFFECLT